jgi:cysteinyl-tRNA synthetase
MHNGMIEVRERKMSKSDGLKDDWILKNLLKKYSSNLIKFYMLSTHYRSPLEFSEEKLEESKKALEKVTNTIRNIQFIIDGGPEKANQKELQINNKPGANKEGIHNLLGSIMLDFTSVMDEDFNSAGAIGVIFDAIKTVNVIIQDSNFIADMEIIDYLDTFYKRIIELYNIFGIDLEKEISRGFADIKAETGSLTPEDIEKMVKERDEARKNKDFKKSDDIRNTLLAAKIILDDRKEGTIWKFQK